MKGALRQAEEVVVLLKALQGNSADALVPSPKRIVRVALPDGVPIFVGGVPREAEDGALLAVFPLGAQIVDRFRGGKGKYGFLKVYVHSKDADQMMDQKVSYLQRKLRVAKLNEDAPKSNAGRGVPDAQHNGRLRIRSVPFMVMGQYLVHHRRWVLAQKELVVGAEVAEV